MFLILFENERDLKSEFLAYFDLELMWKRSLPVFSGPEHAGNGVSASNKPINNQLNERDWYN